MIVDMVVIVLVGSFIEVGIADMTVIVFVEVCVDVEVGLIELSVRAT